LSLAVNALTAALTAGQKQMASPQSGLVALTAAPILAVMLLPFRVLLLAQALPKLFTVEAKMFAKLGTVLVITQMALLSLQFDNSLILAIGLGAAICWAIYAINNSDKWLFITNAAVGGFAIFGLS
jgi:hypothetical protein